MKPKGFRSVLLIGIALVLFFGGGYYYQSSYGPCGAISTSASIEEFSAILNRWQQNVILANAKEPGDLAGPITALVRNRGEVRSLEVPQCLEPARENLKSSMDATIMGFLALKENDAAAAVEAQGLAVEYMQKFEAEISDLNRCVLLCD